MLSLGLVDKKMLLDIEILGEEHQRLEPNFQSGMTSFGEYTRLGSQVEMSKTPEYWNDPLIWPIGSCKVSVFLITCLVVLYSVFVCPLSQ
jgi:hypothetical protein